MAYGLTKSVTVSRTSSQYLTAVDSASLSPTGAVTIEFWIKLAALPGNNDEWELIAKTDRNNERSYETELINLAGTQSVRFKISSGGTGATEKIAIWTQSLSTGSWQHLAFVYTPSTSMDFFINGVSQTPDTTSIPASLHDATTALGIGALSDGSNLASFQMSLVRIWSSARTSSDLSNNWCSVLGSTTNLKAEWTLDNTDADNSGNSNTLTEHNTPTFTADLPSICGSSPSSSISPSPSSSISLSSSSSVSLSISKSPSSSQSPSASVSPSPSSSISKSPSSSVSASQSPSSSVSLSNSPSPSPASPSPTTWITSTRSATTFANDSKGTSTFVNDSRSTATWVNEPI